MGSAKQRTLTTILTTIMQKALFLLINVAIVTALPKPDYGIQPGDDANADDGLQLPPGGKKCRLVREKSQIKPDCFNEPECHWECNGNGAQDENCRPIEERQCKNVTKPVCNVIQEKLCETTYLTQYENQCIEKIEQKCETKYEVQCQQKMEEICKTSFESQTENVCQDSVKEECKITHE